MPHRRTLSVAVAIAALSLTFVAPNAAAAPAPTVETSSAKPRAAKPVTIKAVRVETQQDRVEVGRMIVSIAVKVKPKRATEYRLELLRDGAWTDLNGGTTDARGRGDAGVAFTEAGDYQMRLAVPYKRAYSPVFTVTNPPVEWLTEEEGVREVLASINRLRASHELPPLQLDTYYSQGAQDQADDFAADGEARFIGEYLLAYPESGHPEYPDVPVLTYLTCYGQLHDADDFERYGAEKFLNTRATHAIIGFNRYQPEGRNAAGRYAISIMLLSFDTDRDGQ